MSRFPSSAASAVLLGGLLAAVAFGAQTGADLGGSTVVSILVSLGAGALLGFAVLRGPHGRLYGGMAVLLLAVFTALTALSAAWSISPADTAAETARTFAYLMAFAAAVAAGRQLPHAGGVVAASVAIAGSAVCIWALATRVWPGSLGDDLLLTSRLGAPFDYWNALGGLAALSVPPTLWLAARRESPAGVAALAYGALGLLGLTVALTQSRGALAAAMIVLAIWFAIVPLRLRSAGAVLSAMVAVTPVAAWALSRNQFTESFQSVAAQEDVAGDFGLIVLAMWALLVAAGLVVHLISAHRPPSMRLRRRAGLALAACAGVMALIALTAVATTERGLGGTVSDRFEELTSETQVPPSNASRLASASSSRGEYWRQAGQIFQDNPIVGTGANTFRLARLPYRKDSRQAAHAHGFGAQALADLGLVGLLVALAALTAWVVAAARTLGLAPGRRQRPDWTDERVALTSLAACAVAFGLHAAIDWTWSIPGTAVVALVAAGVVAGRGPLPLATASPASPRAKQASTGSPRGRAIVALGVLVTTLLCCWAIWQPQAASRANDRALDALQRGDFGEAERLAADARELDPYSTEPLFLRADALTGQGERVEAYRTLELAVLEHPRDPDPWLRLADYELRRLDLPARALQSIRGAVSVDPLSLRAQPLLRSVQGAAAGGPVP